MTITPTPHQWAIIEHPLVPLRVTAGAGTGKTTTMAMRLAAKINEGAVAADRTLGVTFTNKAAEELAQSIRRHLAPAMQGTDVEVTTYHGFAFSIVREFGPLIGVSRRVRVSTPGYVRQLLRDSLGAKPRTQLDLTRAGTMVDRLASVASGLGDHLRRPDELADAGSAELRDTRAEIADVLSDFSERKRHLGLVDYSDLVTMAHEVVFHSQELAQRLRDRYDLVLLDEYQDTNAAQRVLILEIFGDGFPVTAVGDSDQTIYEWRCASPENFEEFPRHYRRADGGEADSLELPTSWRSGSRIVAAANAVRSEIGRVGPLPALLDRPDAPEGRIRTHWLRTSPAEASWIASEVRRLHDDEGRDWSEIAILFRKHRHMGVIRDALVAAGVPIEVASLGGLLEVPEVAELHAWLRILGRPDEAPALARILLGSRYRLGLGDLAPLASWVRARTGAAQEASIGWALLEAIDSLEEVEGLSDEARRRIGGFRATYRDLLAIAQGVSLVELCRRVLDATSAWPEIEALPEAARVSARLNTYRFLDLAEDWSPIEGRPSLQAFLDHLDVLREEAASEELDTARVTGDEAVSLLTVHRAKGLEWKVVFLPALAAGVFPSNVVHYEDPLRDPFVIPYELRVDRESLPELVADDDDRRHNLRTVHEDAEWRTAYVAVTRAAEELVGTGAWWYTEGRPRERSPLFEILDSLGLPERGRSNEPGDPPDLGIGLDSDPEPDPLFAGGPRSFLAAALADPDRPRREAADRGIDRQYDAAVEQLEILLEGLPAPVVDRPEETPFRASVTALVSLATCPRRYDWEHVERLPTRPSRSVRHGLELHRRIELHNRGTIGLEEAVPGFYDDVAAPGDEPRPGAFGRFAASRFAATKPLLVEAPFELRIADASLVGRIDAVYEQEDGSWEIVDFKSGRHRDDPARRVQLEAYAVAAEDAALGPPPERTFRVTFAFLGDDEPIEVTESVDRGWLADARRHLEDLMHVARTGPYDPTPGDACRSCDYVRFCDEGNRWVKENR